MPLPVPNLLAIACLVIWVGYELVLRRRDDPEAATWQGGAADRASTLLLVVAFVLAIGLTVVLLSADIGRIPEPLRWIGVVIEAIGLGVRGWSMVVLGRYYTRTVRTVTDQRLVTAGPYRLVRHPGYTGTLLVWTGYCIGVGDWIVLLVVGALLVGAYTWRIHTEEALLLGVFGDQYRQYQRRTRRLIPFVY